jgi:manganese-dependent inorganic pyrophosphatase
MQKSLVTSYINPDLDGTSCVVAYAELLKETGVEAVAGLFGEPNMEVEFMMEYLKEQMPPIIPNAHGYDRIYLMDISEPHPLENRVPLDRVVELIDHRKANEKEKFPNAKAQVELVGAAATLVAERFEKAGRKPSKFSSALLYGAILSNTLNFKNPITTDRDRKEAGWLREISGLPEDFWQDLYAAKSELSGAKLRHAIESDANYWHFKNEGIMIGQLEIMGVGKLLEGRESEILEVIGELKKKCRVEHGILNALDVGEERSFVVAGDPVTRKLCERALDVKFAGNVAVRSGLFLRKQIVPKLKEALGG